jgi:hypothetical protein
VFEESVQILQYVPIAEIFYDSIFGTVGGTYRAYHTKEHQYAIVTTEHHSKYHGEHPSMVYLCHQVFMVGQGLAVG